MNEIGISSESSGNVCASTSVYPFKVPDDRMITHSDLSRLSDFLIHSHIITSKSSSTFVENTSRFISSIKTFGTDVEMKQISNPSEIEKFILRLYEAGETSPFVTSHFFQVELNRPESRGLLVYDCHKIPNTPSDNSLKIVCCPESSLHFEKNFDFVLTCFDIEVVFLH